MNFADVAASFPERHCFYYARRSFQLAQRPERAVLGLAARQYAKVWVNGHYLGRAYLRTHDDELRRMAFDLTPHLRVGGNVVAMLLHAWEPPPADCTIQGLPNALPALFTADGRAGDCDLADLAAWRIQPAEEYRPAPRVGALLGHAEVRDLQREPVGWLEPGFDDRDWMAPVVCEQPGLRVEPSPLRLLAEEPVAPVRIVNQGRLIEGTAFMVTRPSEEVCWWRLHLQAEVDTSIRLFVPLDATAEEMVQLRFFPVPREFRVWLDGVEHRANTVPIMAYATGPWRNTELQAIELRLAAGAHVLGGCYRGCRSRIVLGWQGEARLMDSAMGWGTSAEGPFETVAVAPDPDIRPLMDRIGIENRTSLGLNGERALDCKNDRYMVEAPQEPARGAVWGSIPAVGLAPMPQHSAGLAPPHPRRAGGFWRWPTLTVGGQARYGDCHAHSRLAQSPKSPQPCVGSFCNQALDLRVENEDFSLLFAFERNMTIRSRIEIADASPGAEIEILFSERLSGLKELTLPGVYLDRVILRGGPQVYETTFQYKSAQILGLNIRARNGFVVLKRVGAIYQRYAHDRTGAFQCSDGCINRVWEICRHTMEFGSQDVIMDGPWREQLIYMGDNYVHNQAAYHLFGNHELVEWQHTLYAQGQMPDGIICTNQPVRPKPSEYRLLDQSILWPMQLEHHDLHTGRSEFIRNLLPNMDRLLDGFQNLYGRAKEGDPRLRDLTGWLWVDHHGVEDDHPRCIRHDGISTALNLLYLLSFRAAVRLSRLHGRSESAARFDPLADRLAEQLRSQHWNPDREVFADCVVNGKPSPETSIHVNLLAILAGLAPDANGLFNRTWNQPKVLQMCGTFFRVHLFEVLHRLGRFADILREIRSLWGGYVDAGMTSLPEYIPYYGEWGTSIGHPWGASPCIYLAKSIAGLAPARPGWNETVFDPHLCDLHEIHVVVPTPHGPIRADLQSDGGNVTGSLRVPAAIQVQTPHPERVREVRVISRREASTGG